MYYWVIQEIRGRINAIGPYRSSEAARNRMDKTIGGEIHLFRSLESEAKKAIADFREERIKLL